MLKNKIDCHTHIVNDGIKNEYFAKTYGYAIALGFISEFHANAPPYTAYSTVMGDERLFLCPAIDIKGDIKKQLCEIEALLPNDRIVGIKIFLTYQSGRADDERMLPIYEFASKHRLSVTYHTGSCSLVLPTDNDMQGSNAKYVKNVALKFPDVNFIVAHMDDPRYDECIELMHTVPNMFTDFSGAYEPGTHEGADMEWAIATFAKAINQYPDTYTQILYGTDFCPPINLSAVEEYDYTISKIFSPEQYEDIYVNNALRAFPKIKDYFQKKELI
ncbi:MAG: amidohydrolase [Clostridia bacterium]|nr:amidohydrolase [Clostridia bacterium]